MAIRRHQQTMARLNLTSEDCENIKNHMDQVILKNSPRSHIIVPHAGFSESLALWFQYAQQYPGLDMMYILMNITGIRKKKIWELPTKTLSWFFTQI